MIKHLTVVSCEINGDQALYVGGVLVLVDDKISAIDIAKHAGDSAIKFSHLLVETPEAVDRFPFTLEPCLDWVVAEDD